MHTTNAEIRKVAAALLHEHVEREVAKGVSRSAAIDNWIAAWPDRWLMLKDRPDPGFAVAKAQFGSAIEKVQRDPRPSDPSPPPATGFDEREEAAWEFGKLVDAIQRNFAYSRSEALSRAVATPEGRAHWEKWKGTVA